jgi:hypothetical protein
MAVSKNPEFPVGKSLNTAGRVHSFINVNQLTNSHMKHTLFLAFTFAFLLAGLVASAQSSWSTSKAVNEVANKDLFTDSELSASHIEAKATIQPSSVSMKGVSKVSMKSQEPVIGNIPSQGTPSWVNGKGVSAIAARDGRTMSQPVEGSEQLIPADTKENN